MAEEEDTPKKKGGKGKKLAFLALIGAAIAAITFWRRRSSPSGAVAARLRKRKSRSSKPVCTLVPDPAFPRSKPNTWR